MIAMGVIGKAETPTPFTFRCCYLCPMAYAVGHCFFHHPSKLVSKTVRIRIAAGSMAVCLWASDEYDHDRGCDIDHQRRPAPQRKGSQAPQP